MRDCLLEKAKKNAWVDSSQLLLNLYKQKKFKQGRGDYRKYKIFPKSPTLRTEILQVVKAVGFSTIQCLDNIESV